MTQATTYRQVGEAAEGIGELLEEHGDGPDLERWSEYRDRPVEFIEEVLGGELTEYQKSIARAVLEHPLLTIRSCHAAGKDFLAGRLALWWVYARQGLVVISGPTSAQVSEILMRGEVRDAFRGSGLPGDLHVKALRPGGAGRAGIIAKTATGTGRLTGFHDARVLFLLTEAQDPDAEPAWGAAFPVTTGAEDRIVTLGNPTEPSGRFFEAHQPASDWHAVKIAAEDIPNVRAGETVVPGLLTEEGVGRIASEYGRDSAYYRSRVEAEFPDTAEDSLISRAWIEQAFDRHREGFFKPDARRSNAVVGIDVARFGNDASVACVRRGSRVLEFRRWQGEDTKETARRALQVIREHHDPHEAPVETVVVDSVGIGAGVADQLRDELDEIRYAVPDRRGGAKPRTASLTEFNAGAKAPDSDRFKRLRAQAFWHLRKRLEEGRLSLPPSDELTKELSALRTEVTADGRVALASKRAGLGGDSPDRADALSMTFRPDLESGGWWGFR